MKNKIKVLHQVLDPTGSGGVSAEYRALSQSSLTEEYAFIPMILTDFHAGLSKKDIRFYRQKIKEVSPDIIHIRGAAIDGLNAVIAAKMVRKGKILVTVHGMYSDLVYIGKLKRFISKHIIERLIFSMADGISCVCRAAEQRPYFDRYRKKMLPFVYNRIPHYDLKNRQTYRKEIREEHRIPDDVIVGLYVGRITREKGFDTLIEALQSGANDYPDDLTLLIVGDGDYLDHVKELSQNLRVRMIFTGDRRDVEKFYMAAEFFIQPSLHENHSIALLEACAADLPAVATDCGGNREIVEDSVTGIVVPVADADRLSKGITTMCNPSVRKSFIRNIQSRSYEEFSDDAVDKSLSEVYRLIRRDTLA